MPGAAAPARTARALRLVAAPPLAFFPVSWQEDRLVLLDQRRLPGEEVYLDCRTWPEVADAIRTLAVRGAPAIGVAAAFGVALAGLGARHVTGKRCSPTSRPRSPGSRRPARPP